MPPKTPLSRWLSHGHRSAVRSTCFSIDFTIEREILAIAGGSCTQRTHLYVDQLVTHTGDFPSWTKDSGLLPVAKGNAHGI